MSASIQNPLIAKLREEVEKRIAECGAEPTLNTTDVYFLMARIGQIMRDAGSRPQIDTVTELGNLGAKLMIEGEKSDNAMALLVRAFTEGAFDIAKLKKKYG